MARTKQEIKQMIDELESNCSKIKNKEMLRLMNTQYRQLQNELNNLN